MKTPEEILKKHYTEKFIAHGPTTEGVDWGTNDEKIKARYSQFITALTEIGVAGNKQISILDVGCGYGELLKYLDKRFRNLSYTGIDVSTEMIESAKKQFPHASFYNISLEKYTEEYLLKNQPLYDYVICNGIFTLKSELSNKVMNSYVKKSIKQMYALCNKAVVFNLMSTYVNFYNTNLFYKSPLQLLDFVIEEISPVVTLKHFSVYYEYLITIQKVK